MDIILSLLNEKYVWLAASFLIFAAIVYFKGGPVIAKKLDERIEQIETSIKESENLKTEAQELLAQYKRKHSEAEKEAKAIIENAKAHADEILKNAEKELQEVVDRKERQAEERVKHMENNAESEVKSYAAGVVIDVAQHLVKDNMDERTEKDILKKSVAEVSGKLN